MGYAPFKNLAQEHEKIIEDLRKMLSELDRKTEADRGAFHMALSDPQIEAASRTRLLEVLAAREALRGKLLHSLRQATDIKALSLAFPGEPALQGLATRLRVSLLPQVPENTYA